MNVGSKGVVRAAVRSCTKTGQNLSIGGTRLRPSSARKVKVQSTVRGLSGAIERRGGAARAVTTSRGTSRSKGMLLSALAGLGVSSMSSMAALGHGGGASVRIIGTSAASTLAAALIMPRGATALCAAGRGSSDDDEGKNGKDGKDNVDVLLGMARDALFGGGLSDAVDGAVKRKSQDDQPDGIAKDIRKKINEVMASDAPSQVSFGFMMGICCGFAAKKTAKVALVGVGLAFGSLQVLSYLGYVQLDYTKIEGKVMDALDLDDNGKVDSDDVKELFNRAMKVAAYNLPTGSGFAAGAMVGARMG